MIPDEGRINGYHMENVTKGYVDGGCQEEDDCRRLVVLNKQLGGDAIRAHQKARDRLAGHEGLRVLFLWQQCSESVKGRLLNGASDGDQANGGQIDGISGLSRENVPRDFAECDKD